ncbi:hypothetical protein BDD39_001201 [Saccharococcus thermophilus]|uniref:Uncharacterized protein n=1 Tax=Saccharococcus thermophilus TaxID=29396 RepID=A0A846MCG8_9BACL|nr:hypothetical protein [Saccharococcus thermophilus]
MNRTTINAKPAPISYTSIYVSLVYNTGLFISLIGLL